MPDRPHPPMKDRRDIGEVVFLSETVAVARELSSCCVGAEAMLEAGKPLSPAALIRKLTGR